MSKYGNQVVGLGMSHWDGPLAGWRRTAAVILRLDAHILGILQCHGFSAYLPSAGFCYMLKTTTSAASMPLSDLRHRNAVVLLVDNINLSRPWARA